MWTSSVFANLTCPIVNKDDVHPDSRMGPGYYSSIVTQPYGKAKIEWVGSFTVEHESEDVPSEVTKVFPPKPERPDEHLRCYYEVETRTQGEYILPLQAAQIIDGKKPKPTVEEVLGYIKEYEDSGSVSIPYGDVIWKLSRIQFKSNEELIKVEERQENKIPIGSNGFFVVTYSLVYDKKGPGYMIIILPVTSENIDKIVQ